MTIQAKFPSKCRICGKAIQKGELIEWHRGSRAAHFDCYRHPENSSQPRPDRDSAFVRDPGEDAADRWNESQMPGYIG